METTGSIVRNDKVSDESCRHHPKPGRSILLFNIKNKALLYDLKKNSKNVTTLRAVMSGKYGVQRQALRSDTGLL
jgi:hypothetical protein